MPIEYSSGAPALQRDAPNFATAFLDAMRACGVNMDAGSNRGGHPIADGKLHRADCVERGGKGKKHVWYVLHVDEPASGAFGHYKKGISETWTGGRAIKELTREERAAIKARLDAARKEREAHARAMAAKAAEVAAAMLAPDASSKASAQHPYLQNKGLPAFPGARVLSRDFRYTIDPEDGERIARKDVLLVPMFHDIDGRATLIGLQMIGDNGRKFFLKGTPKEGAFHPVGKHAEGDDLFLAEGYATAARIHEATGRRAVAAFDAGNLPPVVRVLRKKHPRARIVIVADNDRFTMEPVENPGLTKAREAAESIGGAPVVIPQFGSGEDEATDIDDLAQLHGLDAVRRCIDIALNPPREPEPQRDEAPPHDSVPDYGEPMDPHGETDFSDLGGSDPEPLALGIDAGFCFYWIPARGQVEALSASAHSKSALIGLAPLNWWELNFPGRAGVDWMAAANALIRKCERAGVFDPARQVGRGVLMDGGRTIAHLGDRLMVDGKAMGLALNGAGHIFTRRPAITFTGSPPLTPEDGARFISLCTMLPWREPDMGRILAGWCAIAPVCGALAWRSHLWITGERGSGKSTVMERICASALGDFAVPAQGDTTEAGLRQVLRGDLLPIIFDEFESKTEDDRRRVAKVLALARQASSANGAPIIKGSAGGASSAFRVRTAFIFASIDKSDTLPADESRLITLALRGADPTDDETDRHARAERFRRFSREADSLFTPDFAERLFRRSLDLVPIIRANAETFATAIARSTGNRRLGDTLGGPLAGWLSLQTPSPISLETAEQRLASWRWLEGAINRGKTEADHDAALSHLLNSVIRLDSGATRAVGEMVEGVLSTAGVSDAENHAEVLSRNGLRVVRANEPGAGTWLIIANRHPSLDRIFSGQPFSLGTLRQHPAAEPWPVPIRFKGFEKVRALGINLEGLGQ